MAIDMPQERSELTIPAVPTQGAEREVMALYGEELEVSRRRVETALVRATRTTRSREQLVDEELTHERIEVERVPIDRVVESVPPVREEGGTTIFPVVVEEVVVQRRLVLKEEVHLRRVRTTEHHRETVTLREQEATVTRTALERTLLQSGRSPRESMPDDRAANISSNKDQTR